MEEKVWKAFLPTYVSRWKATKQNILISALQSAWTSSLLEVCKRDTIAAFVFKRYVALQCYQHHNNERGSKSKTIVTTTWWFQIQVLLIWTGHLKPLDKSPTYWMKFHHKHWKLEKYLYRYISLIYIFIIIHFKKQSKKTPETEKVQRNKVKETQTIRCGKNNNKMDGLCVQKKVPSFSRFLLHTGPLSSVQNFQPAILTANSSIYLRLHFLINI